MHLRALFVVVYLVVDIAYVFLSSSVYKRAAARISSDIFPYRPAAIVMAWASMATGWYFLAAPLVEKEPSRAALIGLAFGVVVIGTFNFTLSSMFTNWTGAIMYRDLVWGIGWATASLALYAWALKWP